MEPTQQSTETIDNDHAAPTIAAAKGRPRPLDEKSILEKRGRRTVRICASLPPKTDEASPEKTATMGLRTPQESCSEKEPIKSPETSSFHFTDKGLVCHQPSTLQ